MAPWKTPGDIVRWWRTDVLGWSQQQVAERLSVGSTALSNWEHGTRDISIDINQIDRALKADGVLAGLLWTFGTPAGIEPGRVWTKVYSGCDASTPVWGWIRSPSPSIRVEAEWGVARLEADIELGPNGLFFTVGGAVADSPVVMQLSAPGWVDFGRGELPRDIPGAQVVPAVDLARPSTATGIFMDLFTADLADRLRHAQAHERASGSVPAGVLASFVSNFSSRYRNRATGLWPPVPDGNDCVNREAYAKLRQARSLSLAQTVERLAAETDVTASKDTLRRFETSRGEPHHRLLPVALDRVLGAEGHLALTEIRSGHGPAVVRFPYYWHAPVWFAFEGARADLEAELHWGPWWRRIEGELPLLVVSHYAEPLTPLRIVTGRRVRWTAGVGRPAGAIPINHGWIPTSVDNAKRAISETEGAVLNAIRRR